MIDHVTLNVTNFAASRAFYEKALAPLGYTLMYTFPDAAGFGYEGKPDFWIGKRGQGSREAHVAFHCERRALVDAFHTAALAAGGRDNGAPGLRPDYHPAYYGAFALDPDGNNIEAVCHDPNG